MGIHALKTRRGETRERPLFGLRRQPGRLALALFRLPLPLYRRGWGGLLGRTFLLLVHEGRRTGETRATVAMVLRYDPQPHEAVICSAWGQNTDWIRNIRRRRPLRVEIGRESFVPDRRFLTEDESLEVMIDFRRRHPRRLSLLTRIFAWGDFGSDAALREFVRARPFIALSPTASPGPNATSRTG